MIKKKKNTSGATSEYIWVSIKLKYHPKSHVARCEVTAVLDGIHEQPNTSCMRPCFLTLTIYNTFKQDKLVGSAFIIYAYRYSNTVKKLRKMMAQSFHVELVGFCQTRWQISIWFELISNERDTKKQRGKRQTRDGVAFGGWHQSLYMWCDHLKPMFTCAPPLK